MIALIARTTETSLVKQHALPIHAPVPSSQLFHRQTHAMADPPPRPYQFPRTRIQR